MKSSMFRGAYLFHVHTDRTDGKLSVQDYFTLAGQYGVSSIVFLEHIRKAPNYDVEAFISEIKYTAQMTGLTASIGFEAKLLPDGILDISESHLALAEVIGIAEHGFPDDLTVLKWAFSTALNSYTRDLGNKSVVWVHPGLWFRKRGLMHSHYQDYCSMLNEAQDAGVFIENNLRYGLVDESLSAGVAPSSLVLGADAHAQEDLQRWRDWRTSNLPQPILADDGDSLDRDMGSVSGLLTT